MIDPEDPPQKMFSTIKSLPLRETPLLYLYPCNYIKKLYLEQEPKWSTAQCLSFSSIRIHNAVVDGFLISVFDVVFLYVVL